MEYIVAGGFGNRGREKSDVGLSEGKLIYLVSCGYQWDDPTLEAGPSARDDPILETGPSTRDDPILEAGPQLN
ncbi:MAG: hypothetical protein PF542_04710 [Nanoarchaeota archaeon]|jgi:hypothetical protein|nr:hypothetical protein [Nanoarchaeota archaeon]